MAAPTKATSMRRRVRHPSFEPKAARYPGLSPADDSTDDWPNEDANEWNIRGIRWEAEVAPGQWRRYQPHLERSLEDMYQHNPNHFYLYKPGDHSAEGRYVDQPDGHGRALPPGVATRRVRFEPHWREVCIRTGNCISVRRIGPPRRTFLQRTWGHVLLAMLSDASGTLRTDDEGSSVKRISYRLSYFWLMAWLGAISGVTGVRAASWIAAKVYSYSGKLAHIALIIVAVGGPDLLPPLTPLNGSESSIFRGFWLIVFLLGRYLLGNDATMIGIWLFSGLWHLDRGDDHFRAVAWAAARHLESIGGRPSEAELNGMIKRMSLPIFRASAGVGVLWAKFGVRMPIAFYWILALFLLFNIFFNFVTTVCRCMD